MKASDITFDLWLETETGEPLDQPANRPYRNFCNIEVKLLDGRRYALNIWTFDFLECARYDSYEPDTNVKPAKYLIPPDLFVESLDRETVESVIADLLKNGEMQDEWLCDNNSL